MLLLSWEGQGWGQGGSRGPSEEAIYPSHGEAATVAQTRALAVGLTRRG